MIIYYLTKLVKLFILEMVKKLGSILERYSVSIILFAASLKELGNNF